MSMATAKLGHEQLDTTRLDLNSKPQQMLAVKRLQATATGGAAKKALNHESDFAKVSSYFHLL